jgi:hypothetical protein
MEKLIEMIIVSSIKNLFDTQPDILTHTYDTTMTEWNLAHHLSNELSKYIFWLNIENDVTKNHHDNKRPDIIFHIRNTKELDFLVIEMNYPEACFGVVHFFHFDKCNVYIQAGC